MKVDNQTMPSAWYNLGGRVDAARSVALCAMEALPNGLKGGQGEQINHACNLIAALQDLLKLMQQDMSQIETTFKL